MDVKNILVVEDEAINALVFKMLLEKNGFTVVGIAAQGEDAIDKAIHLNPDLILMDIRLAGSMNGIEVTKEIRKHKNIPVIFMSAYTDGIVDTEAKELNPLGFIPKPLDIKELLKLINQ
ncbi:MAG: response regulator [Ignavibacteria bacterium]|nr:response regulator [Ignavibacteria bacterium]